MTDTAQLGSSAGQDQSSRQQLAARHITSANHQAMDTTSARPAGRAAFDHLVVVVADLDTAAQEFARLTGVTPLPGGQHAQMGTHNRLVPLSGMGYLELIALDPAAALAHQPPAPPWPHPRWFDMDRPLDAAVSLDLRHWVIRPSQAESEAEDAPEAVWRDEDPPGPAIPMQRGANRWTLTIRDDGWLPFHGAQPSLIRWQTPHPRLVMGEAQITLTRLLLVLPDAATFEQRLRRARALPDDIPVVFQSTPASTASGLIAELATPRGPITLRSASLQACGQHAT